MTGLRSKYHTVDEWVPDYLSKENVVTLDKEEELKMNRQQKRNKARGKSVVQMVPKKKVQSAVAEEAIITTLYLSLLSLRDEGWGKKRLERFSDAFMRKLEAISTDHVSIKDMIDAIKEETGYEIRLR